MLSVPWSSEKSGMELGWPANVLKLQAVLASWLISGAISLTPERETEAQPRDVSWKRQMSQAGKPSHVLDSAEKQIRNAYGPGGGRVCLWETGARTFVPGAIPPSSWLLAVKAVRHAELWAPASWNEGSGGSGAASLVGHAQLPGCPHHYAWLHMRGPPSLPPLKLPKAFSHH